MDYQSGIVSTYVKDQDLLLRAAIVLKQARSAGMTIIHVQVGFRPKFPEISPRNAAFVAIRHSPQYQQMVAGPASVIHSSVAPVEDDITVTKHRVGAFTGTDLDMILCAKDIDTPILFGIATSGVVLSKRAPRRRRRLPAHRSERLLCRSGPRSPRLPER
jgi:nicotinamidase-related amidase